MPATPWLVPPIPSGAVSKSHPRAITHLPELVLLEPLVAVSGDWHRNLAWALTQIRAAHKAGARLIIQLGDFGIFWPADPERTFERELMWELEKLGMTLIFIDGNHDNHPKLIQLGANQGQRTRNGLVNILPRIWWASRGARFTAGGRTFAALGGAYSVKGPNLLQWVNWWPGIEEPSTRDLAALGQAPADVLLTHEAPSGISYPNNVWVSQADELASTNVKHLVRQGMEAVEPKLVFHGHHHVRATSTLNFGDGKSTIVEALSQDERAFCTVFLDTTTMTVRES